MTPKKRNRNLTSQIYQSQIQQSTSSGSDPDQKVRNSRIFEFFFEKSKVHKFSKFEKSISWLEMLLESEKGVDTKNFTRKIS